MVEPRRSRKIDTPGGARGSRRAAERRDAPDPLVEAQESPPHVVVAEDDAEMRRMLGETLREEGYDATEIQDGRTLRNFISVAGVDSRRPAADLLISDIRMPGCTGLEVLQALRGFDWALPVILITAFGDEETHEEALRLGARKVFDKPFDLEALVAEVREVLPAGL